MRADGGGALSRLLSYCLSCKYSKVAMMVVGPKLQLPHLHKVRHASAYHLRETIAPQLFHAKVQISHIRHQRLEMLVELAPRNGYRAPTIVHTDVKRTQRAVFADIRYCSFDGAYIAPSL